MRLRGYAGSPEPSLVAYVISTIISWAGSYTVTHVMIRLLGVRTTILVRLSGVRTSILIFDYGVFMCDDVFIEG